MIQISFIKFEFSFFFQGEYFEVPAGDLGFTVVLYTVAAVIALGFLVLRRFVGFFGKAELGGPKIPKYISACIFVLLWVMYVLLSSFQVKGIISVNL